VSDSDRIPFSAPSVGEEEIEEVTRALRSGWLTTGPRTARFERDFQAYTGAKHALALNSGTAAMHLALVALGIGPGDEVITTPLTFCSTVHVILQVGARAMFADVAADGNLDPEAVEAAITPRTRALLPVHIGGLPCDMNALWKLAHRHDLAVVEDAAHGVGSMYQGLPIGAPNAVTGLHSQAVAFSFYATKNLATGEGGMVTTQDEALDQTMRRLTLHGIDRDAWRREGRDRHWHYDVTDCGFKYNLSDIQAALGIHQLRKLEGFIVARRQIADQYREGLRDVEGIVLPPDRNDSRHSWQLYAIRLDLDRFNIDRDEFVRRLTGEGIETSVHFIPVPLLSYYASYREQAERECPRAFALYPRLISLPIYPDLDEARVGRVIAAVRKVAREARTTRTSMHGSTIHKKVPSVSTVAPSTNSALRLSGVNGIHSDVSSEATRERGMSLPDLAAVMTNEVAGNGHLPVEQLLGRKVVHLEDQRVSEQISGQRILVTGAGGWIGSELCRQIAACGPEALVGFERFETNLYQIDAEMEKTLSGDTWKAEIGDVRDEDRIAQILADSAIDTVFHAAAYKHVPLMESHPLEAIENNTLGTYRMAKAAQAAGVRNLVMISTDKAVRPVSVMGATKRLSEMIVSSMTSPETAMMSVRFGNVLGSSGSVIPLFERQIAGGEPLTVTHRDMVRYLLTTPEAAQLVMQASTMGRGGEIFVLDMGEPVRILDLAETMIRLAGREPHKDVPIEFIGVRPGEKLSEALFADAEVSIATTHDKIKACQGNSLSADRIAELAREMEAVIRGRDADQAIAWLREVVPSYHPATTALTST